LLVDLLVSATIVVGILEKHGTYRHSDQKSIPFREGFQAIRQRRLVPFSDEKGEQVVADGLQVRSQAKNSIVW
jgi:hypothetical protein